MTKKQIKEGEGMAVNDLGLKIADFADLADWPTTTTTDSGEKRGDLWISTWGYLPTLEVTTESDWETGGDWGTDPGTRRVVFPQKLPHELSYPLMRIINTEEIQNKLIILIEDINKYRRRLYQFKIQYGKYSQGFMYLFPTIGTVRRFSQSRFTPLIIDGPGFSKGKQSAKWKRR
ncbi:MAG: hypothetical protein SVW57_10510 [Thermodesulfobacteriota bacterium]|nr:hypothetical protein [Thermodesulfobacteriota bacterium]MDY6857658.1 hypothetical protein [Thermodesulfobacteriota bacterium]